MIALPSKERAAKLDVMCLDRPELRQEVDSLLEYEDGTPTPAPPVMAAQSPGVKASLDTLAPGRFGVPEKIGQGGFGDVYEVDDRGSSVAVKRLTHHDAAVMLQFKNGFRAMRELRHPNLVRVDELLSDNTEWFLVMELVRGVHFDEYVGATPTNEAGYRRLTSCLAQLSEAIIALHDHEVIHRDIKPSNVLVSSDERVRVLDFGLAKRIAVRHAHESGTFAGTPDYMAPEVLGSKSVTPAVDWYSVGVMLYESLTGRRPFRGHNLEVMLQKRDVDPVPPSELGATPPEALEQLCMELLRRDPRERPEGREVLNRLRKAGGDIELRVTTDDERAETLSSE